MVPIVAKFSNTSLKIKANHNVVLSKIPEVWLTFTIYLVHKELQRNYEFVTENRVLRFRYVCGFNDTGHIFTGIEFCLKTEFYLTMINSKEFSLRCSCDKAVICSCTRVASNLSSHKLGRQTQKSLLR